MTTGIVAAGIVATAGETAGPLAEPRCGRIVLLLDNLGSGGAQRRIATLANRLAELGRDVEVLSVDPGGPMRALLSPAVRVVVLLPRAASRRLTCAVHARALAHHLDRSSADLLMSCVTDTHLLALAARSLARRRPPLVLRASRHPYRTLPWWRTLLEPVKVRKTAMIYARADAIVALSMDTAEGVRRSLRGRPAQVETILNPVIEKTLLDEAAGSVRAARGGVPEILGVGRLVEQKDFGTLLRAFAMLRATRPARLVILGDGPQRDRLSALARRLGISGSLEMPGDVADAKGRMRGADLVVSSSLWEGLQAAPIEALSVGCPVVATDCPGAARETLEDGRIGALVPVRRPDLLATAMAAALDAPPDPLTLARSAARFTFHGKAERYLDLFDGLVAARSASNAQMADRAARS